LTVGPALSDLGTVVDQTQWNARMPMASGRSPFLRGVWLLSALLASCVPVGAPEAPAPAAAPTVPGIEEGFTTPAEASAGAALLERARDALAAGRYQEAGTLAARVEEEYPRLPGSAEALRILAVAALRLDEPLEASRAAERYGRLLPVTSLEGMEGRLLQSEALERLGDGEAAVAALLRIPPGAPEAVATPALERARNLLPGLEGDAVSRLADSPGLDGPVGAAVLVERALALALANQEVEARALAERALALGAVGSDGEGARAIAEGRSAEAAGMPPVLGALLPTTGSPSLLSFAEAIEEGVRLAVEEQDALRRPPVLRTADDRGGGAGALAALAELEGAGVLAVVGPLLDDGVTAAARARTRPYPIVSPTARVLPENTPGVYSLAAADPTAATTLARFALESGVRTASLLYSRTPEGLVESAAFRRAFEAGGGRVLQDLAFPFGASFFQEQLRSVASARPDVLVLPLSPQEIEVVAPQVTFYGLDSLGIRVMGTGGWTGEETLRNLDTRHTDGVVAVTAQPAGPVRDRFLAFERAYEARFRKSLRTPVPALGYDAALLVIRALESGARTPEGVTRALEGIRDFPGATGTLSVEEGRIVRRYHPVRLEARRLVLLEEL